MNPWILASLAACFLGAWVPPIHTQGSFEDCCLGYYPKPKLAVLRRARFYRIQEVSGSCNLFAIIFYFRQPGKMVCGNPRDIRVQKAMTLVSQSLSNTKPAPLAHPKTVLLALKTRCMMRAGCAHHHPSVLRVKLLTHQMADSQGHQPATCPFV
uniref:Chemokine interleukin-8-like domain-containing protein n=1 Tax=Urocitellus parryii TaxID=9999 RepID=A0A8D2H125_UROPR